MLKSNPPPAKWGLFNDKRDTEADNLKRLQALTSITAKEMICPTWRDRRLKSKIYPDLAKLTKKKFADLLKTKSIVKFTYNIQMLGMKFSRADGKGVQNAEVQNAHHLTIPNSLKKIEVTYRVQEDRIYSIRFIGETTQAAEAIYDGRAGPNRAGEKVDSFTFEQGETLLGVVLHYHLETNFVYGVTWLKWKHPGLSQQ